MKKLLSVILAAVMLLCGCAFAQSQEIVISNPVISVGGETVLDLSGLGLRFGSGANEDGMGVRLALEANGNTALGISGSMNEGGIALAVDGISKVFTLSGEEFAMLAEMLAQTLQSQLDAALPERGSVIGAFAAWAEKLVESFEPIEEGVEDYGGALSEIYTFEASVEDNDALIRSLIGMLGDMPMFAQIVEGLGAESLEQVWEALGVELYINGMIGYGETYNSVLANISITMGEDETVLTLTGELSNVNEEESGLVGYNAGAGVLLASGEQLSTLLIVNGSFLAEAESGEFAGLNCNVEIPMGEQGLNLTVEVQPNGLFVQFKQGETVLASFSWENGVNDNVALLKFAGYEASVKLELLEGDAAWIIGADAQNAVSVLSVGQEDMQELSMEALSVLLNAVTMIGGANETIGEALGSVMNMLLGGAA